MIEDHHAHLRRMATQAANEDENALLWALAEIERLTERVRNRDYALDRLGELKNAEIERLQALVERLRAALQEIKAETDEGAWEGSHLSIRVRFLARRALFTRRSFSEGGEGK